MTTHLALAANGDDGFASQRPLDEAGPPLADADSLEGLTEQERPAADLRNKREQQERMGVHKPHEVPGAT